MAFVDILQETATKAKDIALKAGEQIGKFAEETIEVTKLSAKIIKEKSNVANLKKELGELVFKKYSQGEVEEDYRPLCDNIQNSLDLIESLNQEIDNIKNSKKSQPEDIIEKEEVIHTEEKETKICPLCNVKQPIDAKVCEICGYEFND